MHRNKSVSTHQFAMVPQADIPRSSFRIEKTHKTTFDASFLIPIYVDEVLPGDTFNLRATIFARLATPIFPIMDNLYLDTFFFFVPNRLVWNNWQKFMGEQDNPTDTTDYLVPEITTPAGGYAVNSLQDYMGLPTVGTLGAAATVTHNALFLRAYNLIWNQWFRDQNLQDSVAVPKTDASEPANTYTLLRRGKRHDYFTSCLPWTQKGDPVALPLNGNAPVIAAAEHWTSGVKPAIQYRQVDGSVPLSMATAIVSGYGQQSNNSIALSAPLRVAPSNLYADLSAATASTINQIRQATQIQRLLERDARGGTRYTEIVRAHFGVISPDARLQRPEYLGGGSSPVNIHEVAQTSGTAGTNAYTPTPQGNLAAVGTVLAHGHGFTQSFTEHGMIIGLAAVRADLTYQQGLRKMWSRKTKYDFFWPVFSHLGEQAVLNKEIYIRGDANDDLVFGYQERWAEYRYNPSMITGYMRSTAAGTIDGWHLAQKFNALPTLGAVFIQDNPPVDRVVAVQDQANGKQFICDMFFQNQCARPMPMYSVPGLVDHL
ncbi:MAG: major capsid protein [Microviridae sp.]|nr:MAG: major capsid protein [Microviridae sp.]